VARVLWPKGYFDVPPSPGETYKKQFVVFLSDSTPAIKFVGIVKRLDPLHYYTFDCVREASSGIVGRPLTLHPAAPDPQPKDGWRVVNTSAYETIPLELGTLRDLLRRYCGMCESEICADTNKLSQGARNGVCGSLLREVGDKPWYKRLEGMFPMYFYRWYINEMSRRISPQTPPAYTYGSLTSLSPCDIFALVRMAANNSWKLCFWWLHDLPIVEEISAVNAETLHAIFCGNSGDSETGELAALYKSAATAYSDQPFGVARDRGDSFVPMAEFQTKVPNSAIRAALLKHKIVEVLRYQNEETDKLEMFVGVVGDRLCEEQVATKIMEITTRGDDTNVTVFDQQHCWPWNDTSSPQLNEEQAVVVNSARDRRLLNIIGKPGVGKVP